MAIRLLFSLILSFLFTVTFLIDFNRSSAKLSSKNSKNFAKSNSGAIEYLFYKTRNPLTGEIPKDIKTKELIFANTFPKNEDRSLVWQNKGPINLGGRTRAFAIDITNENRLIAGQVSGGIWVSNDAGLSWTKTTKPEQMHSTSCLIQDKRVGKQNIWYCGTGEQYGIVNGSSFSSRYSGDGIFKSVDGGLNWNLLLSTQSNTPTTTEQKKDMDYIWEIVCNPIVYDKDIVYAATVNGIWRSEDGGLNWNAVLGLDTTQNNISTYADIAITDSGILYATISSQTASKGIWRSIDGIQWTRITPIGFAGTYERIEIGIAPSNQNLVYFIAETPGSGFTGHQLWKYEYTGGNGSSGIWTNKTNYIPNDNCTGFFTFDFAKFNSQTSYNLYVVVHPSDPNRVFLGGTNIYRSFNGFSDSQYDWIAGYQCDTANLYNYIYPNHHPDQHKLLFLPSNPNIAYSASDGGIHRTENIFAPEVVWSSRNHNYRTGQFYTCNLENTIGSDLVVGGLQDNGTMLTVSSDPNTAWSQVARGDGSYCAIPKNHPFYILSWQTGKTYKVEIDPDGNTTNLSRIDPTGASSQLFINPFILDPNNDSILYYAGGRFIYRNNDLFSIPVTGNIYNTISTNWTKLNGTNLGIGTFAPRVSCLDISKSNSNILYYGTDNGKIFRVDSCRTNNSSIKIDITDPQFPTGAYASCIDVSDENCNELTITFSNYEVKSIFHSIDAGANWTDISGNLEENTDGSGSGPSVNWIHKTKINGQNIWLVATSIGLFSSTNLIGTNTIWEQEGSSSLGNIVVNMISSRVEDETILVATHGNSMYTNKIISSVNEDKLHLKNIYISPNPASEYININNIAMEKISITDISGRSFSSYNIKKKEAMIEIDISDLPRGLYILQGNINGEKSTASFVKK